jgi:AcrR family transcriptional regulator
MGADNDPVGDGKVVVPIWDQEPPRRRASPGLGRDVIVDVAVEIADRDGLEGLTIRRVADRLGSSPMSLYRHLRCK